MPGSDILRGMINSAPEQVQDVQSSISQIESQIDDLDEQITGVQDGLCAVAESDLTSYLEGTKLGEIEALYGTPLNTPFSVAYGPKYGTINYTNGGITDFTIIDVSGTVEYQYLGANWDSDATIIKLIEDYAFGNDYLTRPLTSGATYGLLPAKTNYETARDLLQENSDKVDASIGIFEDYAS
jgi:hypothetical protein